MGKLIRAVLRGRNGGNTVLLPDKYEQDGALKKLYGFSVMYNPARFSQEEQRNRARSIHNESYLVILRIIDNIHHPLLLAHALCNVCEAL
jgi:hypothetical protein